MRRTLDSFRAGDIEPDGLVLARSHLEICPQCRAAVERRERLDEAIGLVCRDVAVPPDLRERLLAALEVREATVQPATLPVTVGEVGLTVMTASADRSRPMTLSRRRWFGRAIAGSVVALGAAGMVLKRVFDVPPPKVDLHDLAAEAASIDRHKLGHWPGSSPPRMPNSMVTTDLREEPYSLPEDEGAIWFFRIETDATRGWGSRSDVEGRLVSTPLNRLIAPPKAMGFRNGSPFYTGNGFCYSAWSEWGFAFICLVEGDLQDLMSLQPHVLV